MRYLIGVALICLVFIGGSSLVDIDEKQRGRKVFLDFSCSHCMSQLSRVKKEATRLGDKLEVYVFPRSSTCNPRILARSSPEACLFAAGFVCLQQSNSLADSLSRMEELVRGFVDDGADKFYRLAEESSILRCLDSEDTRAEIYRHIAHSAEYLISAVPTWID